MSMNITAQSSFEIVNEKEFARLMAKLVPDWLQFLKTHYKNTQPPAELRESAIRQATAQVAREHPDVLQFHVMTTRMVFRENRYHVLGKYHAPEMFRAMFAEV